MGEIGDGGAQGGHPAPYGDANSDDPHSRCAVNPAANRDACDRIEKREGKSLQEADLGVRQQQVFLDRFDQEADQHPVYERENIGDEKHRHDAPGQSRAGIGRFTLTYPDGTRFYRCSRSELLCVTHADGSKSAVRPNASISSARS